MVDQAPPIRSSASPDTAPMAPVVVAIYAWLATVVLGAIVLDVLLARVLLSDGGASTYPEASAVRDVLFGMVALELLAGLAAIAVAWRSTSVVALLVIAVAVGLGELLVPALLARPIDGLSAALGFALGPWIRIAGATAVSVLAFVALWRLARAR